MEYNAEEFKMKANKKARNVWMTLALIMTMSFVSDTAKGIRTQQYLITFLLI